MDKLLIKVTPRSERGKKNKKIRENNWIPAIVYGNGQKNLAFSLDRREAEKYSKKEYENKIFTLESDDKNLTGLKVIKKSISYHKLSHQPIHMDFLSLDMNKAIRVYVEIKFKGTPKGVKESGGIFNIILRSIELESLPSEIPSSIDLDVSSLDLNQSIHVSDLNISENLKLITKGTGTLCTLVEVAEEKEEEETTPATVTEPSKDDKVESPKTSSKTK